jgi:hypothetical protein
MAIVPLTLSPGAEARVLLNHILEHGDIVGRDTAGRAIIKLAVDDWVLDKLMTFDAEAAELEDADGEPEPDDELDTAPLSLSRASGPAGGGFAPGGHRVTVECRTSSHDPRYKPVLPPVPHRPDRRDARLAVRDQ